MARIETYVFLDLETTSLPEIEHNRTRITELCMLAVKREHIVDIENDELPRVQNKLTMCFNPGKSIDPGSTNVTGLDNFLLEHETPFNMNVFNVINSFLECLQKPVCLIAENGHRFDFPILKNHIEKLKVSLPSDIMCADSLYAFYDILKMEILNKKTTNNSEIIMNREATSDDELMFSDTPEYLLSLLENLSGIVKREENITDNEDDVIIVKDSLEEMDYVENDSKTNTDRLPIREVPMEIINLIDDSQEFNQDQNENTPTKNMKIRATKSIKEVKRNIFYDKDAKPTESYRLKDIYKRTIGWPRQIHRAEKDCIMAAKISAKKAKLFIEWIDENHCPFSEVKAMRPGVPIGD